MALGLPGDPSAAQLPAPSPEPTANAAEPWSTTPMHTTVHCHRLPLSRALLCPYNTTGPQPWFVPVEVIAIGPGSGLVHLREAMQALPGPQMLILRTCLQRHSLHWPQLLYRRSLRLLSPHPDDIKPEWDLGPLLQYIKDDAGGPRPPSGPGHQARGSLRDLGLSCHLLQLTRVHRSNYHQPRGSSAPCSPAIRFQGTWIYVLETSMGSHTMTYRC